jgi:hypothetical protein
LSGLHAQLRDLHAGVLELELEDAVDVGLEAIAADLAGTDVAAEVVAVEMGLLVLVAGRR